MLEKRSQGRPCRGGNEVGRARIIESLREMLRAFPDETFSRKNLAKFAGVTPALITYYFPGRDTLLEEAAKPVVERHLRELERLLAADDEPEVILRQVIDFLFRFYRRDAAIIEVYRDLVRREANGLLPDYLQDMSKRLSAFFAQWGQEAPRRALMLQAALWGVCQFMAEADRATTLAIEEPDDDVESIFEMFAGGLHFVAAEDLRREVLSAR